MRLTQRPKLSIRELEKRVEGIVNFSGNEKKHRKEYRFLKREMIRYKGFIPVRSINGHTRINEIEEKLESNYEKSRRLK